MSGDVAVTSQKHWIPAESNDEVFTEYAKKMGWDTSKFSIQEVLSTEDWALEMFDAKSVKALFLLYVVTSSQEEWRRSEQLKRDCKLREAAEDKAALPPLADLNSGKVDSRIFHVAQNIDNACGTLALVHAAANLSTHCGGANQLVEGSFLDNFVKANLSKTAVERAEALEADETINEAHEDVAQAGQSAVVDDTHNHFVLFVRGPGASSFSLPLFASSLPCFLLSSVSFSSSSSFSYDSPADGGLYDLDGRKTCPFLMKENTTEESFFSDAMSLVKDYMARDPEEVRFSMMVLAPPSNYSVYGDEPVPESALIAAGLSSSSSSSSAAVGAAEGGTA